MSIRFFDWRDIPLLHSYRDQTVFLNNVWVLTGGPLQMYGSLVTSLMPASGVVTLTAANAASPQSPLITQVIHRSGEEHAYLSFFAPENQARCEAALALLEAATYQAGRRGALRLLADVDEKSPLIELLRKMGFYGYTRQRVWRLPDSLSAEVETSAQVSNKPKENNLRQSPLRASSEADWLAIQVLYNNLVPALVKQVEPGPNSASKGLVHYQDDRLLGFIELNYGLSGICAKPFIHPDAEEVAGELMAVLREIPGLPLRRARPVYVLVYPHQSWIEGVLEEMGAQPGRRQVLMVKQLAIQQRQSRPVTIPSLEQGHPETFALSSERLPNSIHHLF